jgi:hypothetical protein
MSADSWADIIDFSPRGSHGLPPGFELVDDRDYPPPPRQTTARSLIGAAESGPNAAIAGMLGGPVDLANLALRGVGLPTGQAPVMGSAWLRDLERKVGINPDAAPDATTAEKIAHAAGYGAAATTIPAAGVGLLGEAGTLAGAPLKTAQAITGAPTAATAGLGAAAGAAGGVAAEAAPEGYKTAAQLAAQLATGHGVGKVAAVGAEAAPAESNIEKFLGEADVAEARAAGAKTRGEIEDFIRNKETANAPRIVPPGVQDGDQSLSQSEGIGQGASGGAPGIPSVPSKQRHILTAARGQDGAKGAEPPPATDYHPPEGFEEIPRGIAPNSAAAAQLAENPAKSTAKIVPGIVPEYSDYAAPGGVWREDEFGMPQLVEATGLRPVDIDPQALEAARTHVANGEHPAQAYERAVVEAALADPKVQGIQDGEQLPAQLPERITGSTITAGGQTFDALNHVLAMDKAGDALGRNALWDTGFTDGFRTSTGRVVSREEAAKIAEAAGQKKPTPPGMRTEARNVITAEEIGFPPGRLTPTKPAQNAPTAPPEPRQAVAGAGPASLPAVGESPASSAPEAKSDDAQRAFIAEDIARQVMEAGRPPDEAEAAGQLWAARFAARAAALGGARGTAEDLYREEGPEIQGQQPPTGNRSTPARVKGAEYRESNDAAIRRIEQAFKEAGLPSPGPENNAAVSAAARLLTEGKTNDPWDAWETAERENAAYGEHLRSIGLNPGAEVHFQRDPAPTFHSAVARAVDNARQEKALPGQWLATLKNTPGVKPEEMKWLGVEDWLKEQKGTVTRQQIADYVRANQIEVREVEKSQDAGRPLVAKRMPEGYWEIRGDGGQFITNITTPHLTEDEAITEARNRLGRNQSTELGSLPKFRQYTLPGGENYRELLLTLPEDSPRVRRLKEIQTRIHEITHMPAARTDQSTLEGQAFMREFDTLNDERKALQYQLPKAYKSPHWEEPNVISHIRFDDRTVNGERALHLAEVQSDWHQTGRAKGYKPSEAEAKRMFDREQEIMAKGHAATPEERQEWADIKNKQQGTTPDAPFKTTWPELAMKRMIRYAAEHGYDRLTWDTGDTNAERYDLSKTLEKIKYNTDTSYLQAWRKGNSEIYNADISERVSPDKLVDFIGKEGADKLLQSETHVEKDAHGRENKFHQLEGLDLKVGGEGMRGFYDRILPAAVNKLTKKFGGKVEDVEVSSGGQFDAKYDLVAASGGRWKLIEKETGFTPTGQTFASGAEAEDWLKSHGYTKALVHSIKITPALEDAALGEGFPLFQGARGKIRLAEGNRPIITLMRGANASTLFHEGGHEFLDEMMRDAAHPAATPELRDDAQTTRDWLGVKAGEEFKARHHERFARGFEQYLREGKAPSAGLARVFEKFKAWLTEIYKTIKGLGKPISNDIRRVFDRLLVPDSGQISGRRRAS